MSVKLAELFIAQSFFISSAILLLFKTSGHFLGREHEPCIVFQNFSHCTVKFGQPLKHEIRKYARKAIFTEIGPMCTLAEIKKSRTHL